MSIKMINFWEGYFNGSFNCNLSCSYYFSNMNEIFIKGSVEQVIDSDRFIYKIFDGEMIWLVNSTKQLQQGFQVEIYGRVSLEIQYKDIGEVSIASLKQVIVDADKVDIIGRGDEVRNMVGIIW